MSVQRPVALLAVTIALGTVFAVPAQAVPTRSITSPSATSAPAAIQCPEDKDKDNCAIGQLGISRSFANVQEPPPNSQGPQPRVYDGVEITAFDLVSIGYLAGLRVGDCITKVNNVAVQDPGTLKAALNAQGPLSEVTLRAWTTQEKWQNFTVTIIL